MNRKQRIEMLEKIYEAFNHPVGEGPTAKVIVPRNAIPHVLATLATEIAVQRKLALTDKDA